MQLSHFRGLSQIEQLCDFCFLLGLLDLAALWAKSFVLFDIESLTLLLAVVADGFTVVGIDREALLEELGHFDLLLKYFSITVAIWWTQDFLAAVVILQFWFFNCLIIPR